MNYIGKGKNTCSHVRGGKGNVWYISQSEHKVVDKGCKMVNEFARMNDLLCSIHDSKLPLVDLD